METIQILQESDYKKFSYVKGNREISKKKVQKIIDSYKNGINLFPYVPVLINPGFFVIEGQHRIEACKILKLPVHYVIVPDLSLQQIAEINSNTDKWKNVDFLKCYIKTGNTNYETLKTFIGKYNITLSVAISLLMNGTTLRAESDMESYRSGKFIVKHQEKATQIMRKCYDYEKVNKFCNDREFIRAIENLISSEVYTHNIIVSKLERDVSIIEKQKTYKDYIFHIEHLYNRKNSIRKVIYK